MTVKEFIYINREKIEEFLKFKLSAKFIYEEFLNNPTLQTPNFSLRAFQKVIKEIYKDNSQLEMIPDIEKTEIQKQNIQKFQKPKPKKFVYDPTNNDGLDDIE